MNDKLKDLFAAYELKAKLHGQRQTQVAMSLIDDKCAYESAKELKAAREALYKELSYDWS
ncbi:Hypothetical protein KNT65_gp204 [Escherichia phage EcS1]|uniref:Uncharacterized protein n=1 Tax=Escherichia phage EcS1 TaxID=2083276 RepID=A0A2Z5ZCB5_9CAUD|nr:Hypothetical protein KNT65_gp204 [Escherichia phage EcS1]BBC78289.1 Hypothetical protein [Escherichia phage EcS1]